MADAPYTGDQAAILPSNTAALLHFSDQLQQAQARRQAQQLAIQRENQMMKNRVNASISSHIFNPNFLKSDASNPKLSEMMTQAANNALNTLNTQGEDAAYQQIYDDTGKIANYSNALKQGHQAVALQAATLGKQNPGIDLNAATNLLATNMFFKKDANGNMVWKDPDELDPNQNYIPQILKEHGQDLFPEESSNDALLKDNKALEKSVNENPNVVAGGKIVSTGYTGKIPTMAMDILPDGKGGYSLQTKSVPYSLNGKDPYIDQQGQTVKVLPPDLADFYGSNNAIAAKAERATRAALNGAPRDSPYGDMLYQKNLHDIVDASLKGYSVTPQTMAAQRLSSSMKAKEFSEGMQQAHLQIAKRNSDMSAERLQLQKEKANKTLTNPDGTPVESNFDKFTNNAQEIPTGTNTTVKYVDAATIPKDQLYQISGSKPSAVHGDVGGVHPFQIGDKKVYMIDDNGNWHGRDGVIDKAGADARQIKAIPKSKVQVAPTETKPNIVQRAVNTVKKGIRKIKGTDQKMY